MSLPANPRLDLLQPYPFERLRALLASKPAGLQPSSLPLVDLSIGEPRHPTPPVVLNALAGATDGLASYPATAGTPALREAIAAWIRRRYDTPVDAATQVLPVNGSREALFSFAQAMLDPAPAIIKAENLLSSDNLKAILVSTVKVFQTFPPLGAVLVTMIGIGLADKSGYLEVLLTLSIKKVPKKLIYFTVVFAGLVFTAISNSFFG